MNPEVANLTKSCSDEGDLGVVVLEDTVEGLLDLLLGRRGDLVVNDDLGLGLALGLVEGSSGKGGAREHEDGGASNGLNERHLVVVELVLLDHVDVVLDGNNGLLSLLLESVLVALDSLSVLGDDVLVDSMLVLEVDLDVSLDDKLQVSVASLESLDLVAEGLLAGEVELLAAVLEGSDSSHLLHVLGEGMELLVVGGTESLPVLSLSHEVVPVSHL